LLEGVKVKLYPQECESNRFGRFCGYNIKVQQFVNNEPDKVRHRRRAAIQQVCQHRLRQASLYLWHTMTSELRHD